MPSEFELIARIAAASSAPGGAVLVGIGDDAAVLRGNAGTDLLACTDTMVAGVHFEPDSSAERIGHKALAVNLSDIAAMGGTPRWALLALTLPQADAAWIDSFVTGFSHLAEKFGVRLVGGDTTRGPMSVTVQLIGEVPQDTAIRRSGARVGDAIYVSGALGDAALALKMRQGGVDPSPFLTQKLDMPEPRVDLGIALRGKASAAIDVSDGMLADLQHLVGASRVGAIVDVDLVPASAEFRRCGGTLGMQLTGGDDYELIVTIPNDAIPSVQALGLTRIGIITGGGGIECLDHDGRSIGPVGGGYDHFTTS